MGAIRAKVALQNERQKRIRQMLIAAGEEGVTIAVIRANLEPITKTATQYALHQLRNQGLIVSTPTGKAIVWLLRKHEPAVRARREAAAAKTAAARRARAAKEAEAAAAKATEEAEEEAAEQWAARPVCLGRLEAGAWQPQVITGPNSVFALGAGA
jgi:hypothetical protein